MSRRVVVGLAVVVLLAGAAAAWLLVGGGGDDDERALRPELRDVSVQADLGYRFADWWGDGASTLQLVPQRGGLRLLDPLAAARRDVSGVLAPSARIADPEVEPSAVAALPGGGGVPWMAIGFPDDLPEAESPERAPRVPGRAWSGTETVDRFGEVPDAGPGTRLPLRTTAAQIGGSAPIFRVALARVDGRVAALVTADQNESDGQGGRNQLLADAALCPDVTACRWRRVQRPDGGQAFGLASTGTGFVLLTRPEEDGPIVVRHADDAALSWRDAGELPAGTTVLAVQHGDGAALVLTSTSRADEPRLGVWRVDAQGAMREAVPQLPAPEGLELASAVLDLGGGDWLVGGSREAPDDVELRYEASSAVLLRRDGDRWVSAGGPLLRAQPDQGVTALQLAPAEDDEDDRAVEMVTSSAVLRLDQLWHVELDEED